MKSEKMPEEQLIEKEAVEEVITDTLNVVNLQRRKERKNAYQILGSVIAVLILLLFLGQYVLAGRYNSFHRFRGSVSSVLCRRISGAAVQRDIAKSKRKALWADGVFCNRSSVPSDPVCRAVLFDRGAGGLDRFRNEGVITLDNAAFVPYNNSVI